MDTTDDTVLDIVPFPIHVPEADLLDLHERLERVRLPERETVQDDSQGLQLHRVEHLLQAWRDHDWRAAERRWNAIPHLQARFEDLEVAFWHVRSPVPQATPLILTHGWPGSVLEFERLIGPLTDPVAHGGSEEDAFHVVIPSLPGFGFSGRTRAPGWDPTRTAHAWASLMAALGYPTFGVHGTDYGAFVSIELARLHPERVSRLHLTMPVAWPTPQDVEHADETEQRLLATRNHYLVDGSGYQRIQATRPQTIGYSLVDSPAGLAAWLGEKMVAYADTRPEAGGGVSVAQQVDNIALYWFTRTGASTARWYWDAQRWAPQGAREEDTQPITVPTAALVFPGEPFPIARRWAERRFTNLVSWTEPAHGGHFAGWEQPDVLVADLRDVFRA
ncbi:epoxide hydrolase family protein [Auraticoccus monumenti]|uniref:Pimeloyl-ACP methyl ester carboxylesterase n=1 Tax=Auraticoccus monumenti TaxID=675864 RepID=A0A1G6Z763_9ACTN|nr:epoxide hydrolase family protein [Auraticoccus monumenti]SDD98302.1 Pimeloyl-ACP methyl ester carboxylesterase [Auraticoccus monumenti]